MCIFSLLQVHELGPILNYFLPLHKIFWELRSRVPALFYALLTRVAPSVSSTDLQEGPELHKLYVQNYIQYHDTNSIKIMRGDKYTIFTT